MRPDRGAVVGTIVSGVAAALWTVWGASGLPTPPGVAVGVVGVGGGIAVVVLAARQLRTAASGGPTMFRTRAYRLTVAAEVAAIVAGAAVLGATGAPEFVVAWVAFVVGVHFLVFGRLFRGFFYGVGALLVLAALVGTLLGLTGAPAGEVVAVTGLAVAATFLAAGITRVARPVSAAPPPAHDPRT